MNAVMRLRRLAANEKRVVCVRVSVCVCVNHLCSNGSY